MSAAGYKPVHGGYPGEVPTPKPKVYVVSYADDKGNPVAFNRNEKYAVAWMYAGRYGGNGDVTSKERGHFTSRVNAERYAEYRRESGESFAVVEL